MSPSDDTQVIMEMSSSSSSNQDIHHVKSHENRAFALSSDESSISASPSSENGELAQNSINESSTDDEICEDKRHLRSKSDGQIFGKKSKELFKAPSGFTVTWRNLDYVIDNKWWKFSSNRRPILNGLCGSFRSGQLSAILGPSGAGKSSLIDCLLGLKPNSSLKGSIRVNFDDPSEESERRRKKPLRIALIPQQDNLLDSLTVIETFMFASRIKNAHIEHDPITGLPFDHKANVQRVIKQLKLTSCATNRCSKLSGGQYKRVSIGQELLSRPELMILDEPTSGLDSVTCYQTVNALRELIEASPYPLSIIATIHQPDIEVFGLFHKAYVLACGGKAIYEGPTDRIQDTVKAGIRLVEARRSQSKWQIDGLTASKLNTGDHEFDELHKQLDSPLCNSARTIVEVAANEYGYELISALNEIQKSDNYKPSPELKDSVKFNWDSMKSSGSKKMNNFMEKQQTKVIEIQDAHKDGLEENNKESNIIQQVKQQQQQLNQNIYFDYELHNPSLRRMEQDELLNLRTVNMAQHRSMKTHLRHIYCHMHRSWLTILRDPMLFLIMVILHISVPLLISYCFYNTYKADACPFVGPFDVLEEAYRTDNSTILMDLNREIRATFENLGYMFFQIYVIIFAGVCVTSLTYPIVMHVLLKEFRNGWYSMVTYFIGRTLADIPVPTANVFIAMAISYHLTGQPLSPYGWRFLSVAGVTILATLVAQTQGLMFGALLMNAAQSAVFVAPASTAPLVVVSGFLIRLKSLPWILQFASNFSLFTHLLNGFIVARYGFNKCGHCDKSMFSGSGVPQIPDQARVMIDIWAETYASEYTGSTNATALTTIKPATLSMEPTTSGPQIELKLVEKLIQNIEKAKMFGYDINDCSQYKPFPMLDYELEDWHLYLSFGVLALMLIISRWFTFVVLNWKIKSSI